MLPNGAFQLDFVKRLAFNRLAGSPEELTAVALIQEAVAALGGDSHTETFPFPWYEISNQSVEITAPFTRTLEATGVGRSGCTPPEGIEAPLHYAQTGTEIDLRGAAGKIVLLNSPRHEHWRELVLSGALAFIAAAGEYDDDPGMTDLDQAYLRAYHLRYGQIPGLTIRTRDAIALLQDGAQRVRVTLTQDETQRVSRNVVAEIPGSDRADEIMVFTAHYDSVPFSRGAWDNASGSADILMLYRYFLENRPRRTMRFIWCGAEERGLLGSKAYVEAHRDELDRLRFCLNIDMTGTALGYDLVHVTADGSLVSFLEYLSRERGFSLQVQHDVHSSDSTPFADAGVPAVGFKRAGAAAMHCRRDLPDPLSAAAFARTQDFFRAFAARLDAADTFPVPRTIPPEIRGMIDRYFHRDEA